MGQGCGKGQILCMQVVSDLRGSDSSKIFLLCREAPNSSFCLPLSDTSLSPISFIFFLPSSSFLRLLFVFPFLSVPPQPPQEFAKVLYFGSTKRSPQRSSPPLCGKAGAATRRTAGKAARVCSRCSFLGGGVEEGQK